MLSPQNRARRQGRSCRLLQMLFILTSAALVAATVLIWPESPAALSTIWQKGEKSGNEDQPRANAAFRPVANDCARGVVYFTFDDGPYFNTAAVLDRLKALNIRATFYVIGDHLPGREEVLQRELFDGHSVQNHSYHHINLVSGVDVRGVKLQPWGDSQIEAELEETNIAIVETGAPRPTQYRPPYGSVNHQVDQVAKRLGLRLVMPWGNSVADNIVDSKDTEKGTRKDDIIRNVTSGIKAGSIVSMHDGQRDATLNDIEALQSIADYMNSKHLCSSTDIRPDATGGVPH